MVILGSISLKLLDEDHLDPIFNLYVFALFLSNQFPRSMEKIEEDLSFFLYLHICISTRI
jgi:hypothetical protein